MAVSIKNEDTERLARELAKRTELSITEAITTALREQLAREEGKRSAPRGRDELLAIGRRCAALPISIGAARKRFSDTTRLVCHADESAMVIDSSAALPILLGEVEDDLFAGAIDADPTRIMSAVSVLEASIVVEARKGPAAGRELDLFLHTAGSMSFRSMHTSWSWHGTLIAATAKGTIALHSISGTAAPTPLLRPPVSRSCSRRRFHPHRRPERILSRMRAGERHRRSGG